MKKFTKLTLAATALLLGSTAQTIAGPTITVSATSAGATVGQCDAASGFTGSFSGSTCTMSATNGVVFFTGSYGNFDFEEGRVVGNGDGSHPLEKTQPALWLNSFATATTQLGSMTITAVAKDYSLPALAFFLDSALSGTTDGGMTQSAQLYFDDTNSGVAGVGDLLMSETFNSGFGAQAFNGLDLVQHTGLYSVSWIYTVTRFLDTGESGTATFAGTLASVALPGPAGLALLGFGLIGTGLIRRRTQA